MTVLVEDRLQLPHLVGLVESALSRLVPDPGATPHRLHAAMHYAVLGPGKRIRPVLTLLCAGYAGGELARALPGACAVELVHAASLVFDDLPCMDNADERRGRPSVHVRYGEAIAVLTGVALLNAAVRVLSSATELDAETRVAMTTLLSDTVGADGLSLGQEQDLAARDPSDAAALRDLHHRKTGVLFLAAAEMGALAAGASAQTLQEVRGFAREFGLAYQALDDLADAPAFADGRDGSSLLNVMTPRELDSEARARLHAARAALRPDHPRLAGFDDLLSSLSKARARA